MSHAPRRPSSAATVRRGIPAATVRRGIPAATVRRGIPAATVRRGIPAATVRRGTRFGVIANLGLLLFSSLLFALSFPSFLSDQGWFPLGFVCLVPLFVVVRRASWAAVPFYGLFFGYVSYALFNYWLGKFHPLTLVVVPPIYAAYFLVTLPALKLADTLFPRHPYLVQSALWVCYEYFLKSNGFLAYSYGNLGYSQYDFLPLIQVADTVGVWGVSLLVVYPSSLLGRALADGLPSFREGWRRYVLPAACYAVVFFGVVAYGLFSPVDTRSRPAVEGGPCPAGCRSLEGRVYRLQGIPRRAGAAEHARTGGEARDRDLVGDLVRPRDRLAHALPARTRRPTAW